jgi:glucosyl-3-phosphoglycerate synthase
VVDLQKWIDSNTYHHSQFWDLKELVKAKEKKGLKISLCLPTLNEEKTIGKEVILSVQSWSIATRCSMRLQ